MKDHESQETLTMSVWPDAGQKLGLGKNSSYQAARCGQIPTIRIGKKLRVPIAAFNKMLESVGMPSPQGGLHGK